MYYEMPVVGDDMLSPAFEVFWVGTGQATPLHHDADDDPAEAVRRVAEEVAGRDMPRTPKPRIGFW